MKKVTNVLLTFMLCISLMLSLYPAAAASGTGTPTPSASAQPSKEPGKNEPTYNTKYTVKKIKKPPYCITVNGAENQDFSNALWVNLGVDTQLNVVGTKEDDGIAGEWQFFVNFKMFLTGDAVIEGVPGGLEAGLTAEVNGSAKGTMVDLVEQKKKEKEEKKNEWQPVEIFPSEKPSSTPTPIRTDPDTARNSQEAPKELYKCEFEVNLSGTIENLGPSSIYGTVGDESQWIKVDMDLAGTAVNTKGKVTLMVDSNNNAVATVEADGKSYGPYAGVFTCEEDLDIQRKDTGTWPIWGVWTDVNPYEPMPNIVKDLATIEEQVKNGDEPKKINYPVGRWVALKQGKKGDPTTYATLQVSKDDITYESGEIWPYPGSAMFKPTARTVYSKDLLTVIKADKPMDYEVAITYHTANDTIFYPGFGNLVRVRDANLLGVWSSVGNLEMPKVSGNSDLQAGTWYEFVRGGEDTADQTVRGYSAAYTFTRITVARDKSMVIDKGTAVILPIADDEMVTLLSIKSEKVSPDGKKSDPVDKENETLTVTDFDKAAGTVKLGTKEYTFIPGLKLEGKWSTMDPPLGPPDVKNGAFKTRDENGNTVEPPADSQWIEFDSKKKAFVWTSMLSEPEGILVREGSYKTYGEDLLMLSGIKGSFYPVSADDRGFTDKADMYGEKLFQVELKTDEDKNPVSLEIAGETKFNPIPAE